VSRRIPLPRLTQQQRTARWQRERRQQTIIVVVFTVLLCSAIGLMVWAGANRYYDANLKPVATIDGHSVPYRLYSRERAYELVKFYQDNGIPAGYENDPQVLQRKADYDGVAINSLAEQMLLDTVARADRYAVSDAEVRARYVDEFSQYRTRHILVKIDTAATDQAAADKAALAKATEIAAKLKADPNNKELWNTLAKTSDDTGSKDTGGEIGWASKGNLVAEYEAVAKTLTVGAISDPVKTSFGYHVIQLEERRGAEANPLVARWLTNGFGLDEILLHTRYDMLREHYTAVAQSQSVKSPTEQLHLQHIVINLPAPSSQMPTNFTTALKKVTDVKAELAKGTDFATVAKQYSDDKTEADAGGDIGWFARGQLDSVTKETELFALAPGTVSRQFSSSGQTEFYRVVEKDPARALTDAQTTKIKDSAYAYWFDKNRRLHDLQKLVSGYEFAP
jgi:parvulin-like peptidyl-prolyl isomerase